MIAPLLTFVLLGREWPGFKVQAVDMAFKMPAKPEMKSIDFMHTKLILYTEKSTDGFFMAGYAAMPAQIQPAIKQQINMNPGGDGLKGILTATVSEFAKAGKGQVVNPQYGQDLGLPAEFATVVWPKATYHMRVYVGPKATYLFIHTGDLAACDHYFKSIELPAEIPTRELPSGVQ